MKKELKRKLSLSKTTIANLVNNEMQQVKGGYISFTCPDITPFCPTEEGCTTGCVTINPLYCDPRTRLDTCGCYTLDC